MTTGTSLPSPPGEPGTVAAPTGAPAPGTDRPARAAITRTTITPAPGTAPAAAGEARAPRRPWPSRSQRWRRSTRHEPAARQPVRGCHLLRTATTLLLAALCLLTVGGAILMLLLWQQDRASGVLTSQLDRTWNLFEGLAEVERWVAFGVVPVAAGWIALAAVNVRRATGLRRDPFVAAAGLLAGLAGIWLVGHEIVAEADDRLGELVGVALQAVFAAIPLLALERVAEAAEARRRPLRAAYLIAVAYLFQLQVLGGLSTIARTADPDRWPRLGAYLVIGALLQLLGTLACNEAARAVEEGTEHRYQLRHRFGGSLLAQVGR